MLEDVVPHRWLHNSSGVERQKGWRTQVQRQMVGAVGTPGSEVCRSTKAIPPFPSLGNKASSSALKASHRSLLLILMPTVAISLHRDCPKSQRSFHCRQVWSLSLLCMYVPVTAGHDPLSVTFLSFTGSVSQTASSFPLKSFFLLYRQMWFGHRTL